MYVCQSDAGESAEVPTTGKAISCYEHFSQAGIELTDDGATMGKKLLKQGWTWCTHKTYNSILKAPKRLQWENERGTDLFRTTYVTALWQLLRSA